MEQDRTTVFLGFAWGSGSDAEDFKMSIADESQSDYYTGWHNCARAQKEKPTGKTAFLTPIMMESILA